MTLLLASLITALLLFTPRSKERQNGESIFDETSKIFQLPPDWLSIWRIVILLANLIATLTSFALIYYKIIHKKFIRSSVYAKVN